MTCDTELSYSLEASLCRLLHNSHWLNRLLLALALVAEVRRRCSVHASVLPIAEPCWCVLAVSSEDASRVFWWSDVQRRDLIDQGQAPSLLDMHSCRDHSGPYYCGSFTNRVFQALELEMGVAEPARSWSLSSDNDVEKLLAILLLESLGIYQDRCWLKHSIWGSWNRILIPVCRVLLCFILHHNKP